MSTPRVANRMGLAVETVGSAQAARLALPGEPSLAFAQRLNMRGAERRSREWATLVVYLITLAHMRSKLTHEGTVVVLLYCAALAANLAWSHLPDRGRKDAGASSKGGSQSLSSFVSWREGPSALLRFLSFWLGTTLTRHSLLNAAASSSGTVAGSSSSGDGTLFEAACYLAVLLLMSGAFAMAQHALVWRTRLGLSAAAQAAMLAVAMANNDRMCASPLVARPAVRRSAHRLYELLRTVGALVPLPLAVGVVPDADAECRTLLIFCQIGLGFMAPLLWEVLCLAQQFEGHLRQRQAAGLPPEQGPHASLLGWVSLLSLQGNSLHIAAVGWVLLSVCFDWCAFFAAPPGLRLPGRDS